jgi:hypothetical protein
MRHACARATTRPEADSDALSSSTDRPGRSTVAATASSATGTGPRISTVTLAIIIGDRVGNRSIARVSNADGGPRCWVSGDHGPVVCTVDAKRSSPSGS